VTHPEVRGDAERAQEDFPLKVYLEGLTNRGNASPELRFSATVGQELEFELALV